VRIGDLHDAKRTGARRTDDAESILLDPGGHKVHYDLMNEVSALVPINELKYLFFSHQDPDIVAAANAGLMLTDAVA